MRVLIIASPPSCIFIDNHADTGIVARSQWINLYNRRSKAVTADVEFDISGRGENWNNELTNRATGNAQCANPIDRQQIKPYYFGMLT